MLAVVGLLVFPVQIAGTSETIEQESYLPAETGSPDSFVASVATDAEARDDSNWIDSLLDRLEFRFQVDY